MTLAENPPLLSDSTRSLSRRRVHRLLPANSVPTEEKSPYHVLHSQPRSFHQLPLLSNSSLHVQRRHTPVFTYYLQADLLALDSFPNRGGSEQQVKLGIRCSPNSMLFLPIDRLPQLPQGVRTRSSRNCCVSILVVIEWAR